MATTVFILGAGASKQAGVPLMMEFLDSAHDLWKRGDVSQADAQFSAVFNGISELQRVHSKSQLDIHNVESVFTAFEMARTLRKFGDYKIEAIENLVGAMKSVIVQTIEKTLIIPVEMIQAKPPQPYVQFADVVSHLRSKASPKQTVAIITFNYDMALDYTLYFKGFGVDYGFGETQSADPVPLLKLHGSLNWAQCKECGSVVPWTLTDYFKKYTWQLEMRPDIKTVELKIGSQINSFQHCGKPVLPEPFVVPPTGNKAEQYSILSNVWSRAANELTEAENIYVIGYSLPPTDDFFRYLFALGTVGDVTLRKFWVFNPEPTGVVEDRFRQILGAGALQRYKYHRVRFNNSISTILE